MTATVSRSNAILMAVLSFAAGVFVSSIVFTELRPADQHDHGPAPQTAAPAKQDTQLMRLEAQTVQSPDSPEAWIALGNAAFDRDMPQKAIAAYEQALRLQPGNANVLTDLGVMYRRAGQPHKAVESFEKAIAAQPEHQISRLNLGVVRLHDLNDPQGALEAWRTLLSMNPNAAAPGGKPLAEIVQELQMDIGQ